MTPSSQRRRAMMALAGRTAAMLAGSAMVGGSAAYAQSYPDKPIHLVVPFPPGGLTDSIGRMVAEKLKGLGQPVIVENRPGAGTLLAGGQVAKAAPDGYTLMVATSTTLGIAPALFKDPPMQIKDLTGVAMVGDVTLLLVVRPDFPANSLQDLVRLVRDSPGKYNYATPGNGTVHHLVIEMLKQQERLFAAHIPYRGSGQAMTDLISGSVDFMLLDAAIGLPQVKAGRLKAVSVTGTRRSPLLPAIAPIGEVFPDINLSAWQSIAAPAGTPAAIVERLNKEINAAIETGGLREQLLQVGVDATPMSPAQLNQLIARDATRWERLVKTSGARVD